MSDKNPPSGGDSKPPPPPTPPPPIGHEVSKRSKEPTETHTREDS